MNLLDSDELRRVTDANPVKHPDSCAADTETGRELLACLVRSPRPSSRRVTKRGIAVAAGGVLALSAVGGVAAASGLIPEGVTKHFEANPNGQGVTDAHIVAETTNADGISVQIWNGHNSNDGRCSYTRTVSADGSHEDGSTGCFYGPGNASGLNAPPEPRFVATWDVAGNPLPRGTTVAFVHTTIGSITRISVAFTDGEAFPLTLDRGTGYALAIIPAALDDQPAVVTAYDAAGNVVATRDLPAENV